MDLDRFKLLRTAFEVRYASNYRLWDRAGQVAIEILSSFPGLEVAEAAPNKQQFVMLSDDKKATAWTLVVELGKCVVLFHKPARSLELLPPVIVQVTSILNRALELETYTRVGTRMMFVREYPSIREARAAVIQSGLVNSPVAPIFGKAELVAAHVALTYSRDGTGVNVQLYGKEASIQELSKDDEEIPLSSLTTARLMYDVDRFTEKPLPVGAFKWQLWIEELTRMVSRDSMHFLKSI